MDGEPARRSSATKLADFSRYDDKASSGDRTLYPVNSFYDDEQLSSSAAAAVWGIGSLKRAFFK